MSTSNEYTRDELKAKLEGLNATFNGGGSLEYLQKTLENIMSVDKELENIVQESVQEMIDEGQKYNDIELVKHCVGKAEDQNAMFDFVREHGERIAKDMGLIESSEARKARIEANKAEKSRINSELTDYFDGLELPDNAEDLKELLESAAEEVGTTVARARAVLKPLYGDNPMPKVVAKKAEPGFKGYKKIIADAIISNPSIDADQIKAIMREQLDSTEGQFKKYDITAENMVIFAQKLLGQ